MRDRAPYALPPRARARCGGLARFRERAPEKASPRDLPSPPAHALARSGDSAEEKRLLKFADEEENGKLEDAVVFSDKLHYSPTSMANDDLGHGGGVAKATCCLIQ